MKAQRRRRTYPRLARNLVRVLDEAQPFGVEHRLDACENANGDRHRLLVTDGVWDLPGNGRISLHILSKGTLVLVHTSNEQKLGCERRS